MNYLRTQIFEPRAGRGIVRAKAGKTRSRRPGALNNLRQSSLASDADGPLRSSNCLAGLLRVARSIINQISERLSISNEKPLFPQVANFFASGPLRRIGLLTERCLCRVHRSCKADGSDLARRDQLDPQIDSSQSRCVFCLVRSAPFYSYFENRIKLAGADCPLGQDS